MLTEEHFNKRYQKQNKFLTLEQKILIIAVRPRDVRTKYRVWLGRH